MTGPSRKARETAAAILRLHQGLAPDETPMWLAREIDIAAALIQDAVAPLEKAAAEMRKELGRVQGEYWADGGEEPGGVFWSMDCDLWLSKQSAALDGWDQEEEKEEEK